MNAGAIAGGAPTWVWALLVALVALGVRRLRTREVPIAVALLPSIAFLVWSLAGAVGLARLSGTGTAALAWGGGALLGIASTRFLAEPRGRRLPGGRVLLPGSWQPLALYLVIFAARFACGAWAAIRPAEAVGATAVGVTISAAMTARLVAAVARWGRG